MKILFFDADCLMCNKAVQFVLLNSSEISFAGLDGKYASTILNEDLRKVDSIIFFDEHKIFQKSEAVFALLNYIPRYKFLRFLRIIPRVLRDKVYDFVARNRKSWFKNSSHCVLLEKEQKQRFLDNL